MELFFFPSEGPLNITDTETSPISPSQNTVASSCVGIQTTPFFSTEAHEPPSLFFSEKASFKFNAASGPLVLLLRIHQHHSVPEPFSTSTISHQHHSVPLTNCSLLLFLPTSLIPPPGNIYCTSGSDRRLFSVERKGLSALSSLIAGIEGEEGS